MEKSIKEYISNEALNYSLLASLDKDVSKVYKDDYSDFMKLGDAVDVLLTNKDEFNEKFIINYNQEVPSDNIRTILTKIGKDLGPQLKDYKERILLVASEINYGQKWKSETILTNIYKYNPYFRFLLKSEGKIIIEFEEFARVQQIVNTLKTSDFTKMYFKHEMEELNQHPLYFSHSGYNYKCLLDKILIDNEKKEVYPIDIKTMGEPLYKFKSTFFKWRRDLQASMYYHACKANFKDYKILDFRFVVGSFADNKSLVFNAQNYQEKARDGYVDSNGIQRRGWLQLSEDFLWHKENNKWDFSRQIYDSQGELLID